MDTGIPVGDHPGMSESPYAISADDLERSVRVPLAEQVTEQAEPRPLDADTVPPLYPWADGACGDADG